MAQASARIIPGYTLTGTTPTPGEAPVTYAINGVVVGTDLTANIAAGAIGLFFNTISNPDGTFSITVGQSNTKVFTGTRGEAASFTAGINNAVERVLNRIHTDVTTPPLVITPIEQNVRVINATPVFAEPPIAITPIANTVPVPLLPVLGITPSPIPNPVPKAAPTTTTDPSKPSDSTKYTVKKGDTLSAIAKKYNTTVEALLRANPQITNPNLITAGQVINIPNKTSTPRFNSTEYTVKKGDTLSAIAKKYNTTVDALLKANPQITNPNLIKVGQVIKIPGTPEVEPTADGVDILDAQSLQGSFDRATFEGFEDWRVRLSLAPGSTYLYASANPGIMQPLQDTNGVVFPYTPGIGVNYAANYNAVDLVHSNYKVQQYTNSSVDSVNITCDFTAQDVYEARYLLAVIHFFKSMTKMFYGQDVSPIRGTPPPLCYMYGLGGYQFSAHPLGISGFNYNLPNDVDYIKTTAPEITAGVVDLNGDGLATTDELTRHLAKTNEKFMATEEQRLGKEIQTGGRPPPPQFSAFVRNITTYVPTKISLTITCVPIMSRNQVSNYFSLRDYGTGKLVNGVKRQGGGFW